MARILYDDGFTERKTITVTPQASAEQLIGDINNLDAGPARFRLPGGEAPRVKLSFTSGALPGEPRAVVVIASIVSQDTGPAPKLVRNSTATGPDQTTDVFGTDLTIGRVEQRAAYATILNQVTSQTVEITLNDQDGAGELVFDIEQVLFLKDFLLPEGIDKGWSMRYADLSQVEESDAGAVFATQRRVLREIDFALSGRALADIFITANGEGLVKILRAAGRTRPIMVIPREAGEPIDIETAILGRVVSDSGITNRAGDIYDSDRLVIREF